MAGPTFRASTQVTHSGPGTTQPVTKPTGVSDGDFLVVQCNTAGGAYPASTGWTRVNEDGFAGACAFWKVASGEGASWSFTGLTSFVQYNFTCQAFQPAAAGTLALDSNGFGGCTNDGTKYTSGSITTAHSDTNISVAFMDGIGTNASPYAPGTGLTEDEDVSAIYSLEACHLTTNQAVAGSSGTFTTTPTAAPDANGRWGMVACYEAPATGAVRPHVTVGRTAAMRSFR